MHFFDVRKSSERQASKRFYNKCSENSRSQIIFRTDIFRKLTLGAPAISGNLLIVGDFNFHLEDSNNTDATKLHNLLKYFKSEATCCHTHPL